MGDMKTASSSYESELNSSTWGHMSAKYHGEEEDRFPSEDEDDDAIEMEDKDIWNAFLTQHNGAEPLNEWALHKWIKTEENITTITFKNARELFRSNKGNGIIAAE